MSDEPRSRVIAAALSCFAAKGFSATTIAEIEAAAGLSPGAGGTYRHFKSKRAILDAVIDSVVEQDDVVLAPVPKSLKGAARDALANMDRQRDVFLLLLRDLDQFPELLERVIDRLITGPYRVVAQRTAAVAPSIDAEATSALLLSALVNFKLIEMLVGSRLGSVSEDRIVAAWAHLYSLVIEGAKP
jgi:AcrR family transcriptional regulator